LRVTSSADTVVVPLALAKPGYARILWRCLSYLRPRWKLMAGAYAADIAAIVISLLTPQFIRWIVDQGIRQQDMGLLRMAVLALLGMTLIKGVFGFLMGRWTEVASQGVAFDLRNAIHHKLSLLSFAYHDQAQTGQLLSRAIQDVDLVRFLTGRAVLRAVESALLLIGTAIMLVTMNPRLALLTLVTMPFLIHRALYFGVRFRPISVAIQQQLAVVTAHLEENLRGARVVKAFAQEAAETVRFDEQNDKWFVLAAGAARLQATNLPLMDLIANISSVAIIWYGGTLVIHGQLTLGELVAFTTYLGSLLGPVRRLGNVIPAIAQAAAGGERIFDILDARSEVQDEPSAAPLPPVRGLVRIEHVSFNYLGRHLALDDINLTAEPGQIVAFLGQTGSGKSTLINLIPRFYDPTSGRVTIDGHDIRHVTLNSLRDQVGIVLQGTTLFAATLRENIAFGRPGATEAEVMEAARAAQVDEFVAQMPQGYETLVGERGVTLSGGQKQRVAIARTLLKDPRILILDDALSSVDTETEHLIQMALEQLMKGRTSFVIAQRLSTIRMADLIVVLEHGKINACGTHESLLRTCELYAQIYEQQLRPQEVALLRKGVRP
jgi:ATP-binding cassette, subfamily B, multidrug efflux pump